MTRQTALIPTLIALVGVLLGYILGVLSAEGRIGPGKSNVAGPTEALSPFPEEGQLDSLLVELRTLGDRIESLTRLPLVSAAGTKTNPTPSRREISERPPTELTDLLTRLTEEVSRIGLRSQPGLAAELQLSPSQSSPKALLRYDESRGTEANKKFTQDHLLLTYQQVLNLYGKPSTVSRGTNGIVYWNYSVEKPTGGYGDWSLRFTDGRVMRGML